jgi:hypothetical protein
LFTCFSIQPSSIAILLPRLPLRHPATPGPLSISTHAAIHSAPPRHRHIAENPPASPAPWLSLANPSLPEPNLSPARRDVHSATFAQTSTSGDATTTH